MKLHHEDITTPVYLKTSMNMPWPKDKMFYILSSQGLYLCRNHDWFTSCSLSKHGPGELEPQTPFMHVNYPKIPKHLMEQAMAFFRKVFKQKHWESALILAYNRNTNQVELICPEQKASAASVDYEIPKLPQHLALIGDIHSHCDFSPNPSWTDEKDETYRPGLHIVAGYVNKLPEFYCCAVADGTRFEVKNHLDVWEGFDDDAVDTDAVPEEWMGKLKAKWKEWSGGFYTGGSYGGGGGDDYYSRGPDKDDEKTVDRVLGRFLASDKRPIEAEVRQALFGRTKVCSLLWCEKRATKFMDEWDKEHGKVAAK